MYAPAVDTEIISITRYIDAQLEAIRSSVVGLTEQQATERPLRSELTISGLVTHATYVMRQGLDRFTDGPSTAQPDMDGYADFLASFSLNEGQTTSQAVEVFDEVRREYLAAVESLDPDADTFEPPAPWAGLDEPTPTKWRYYLHHHIEEFARHAGHADIIREQIDGVQVPTIVNTRAAMPANPWFQPYEPAAGTLV